ncbi:hypothetical protein HELRODRAFT_176740 [Helobdella robusta]|uniref:Coiled-coil domain-containing protein 13 n=1 Tax=Helobdella robusta TaxID=6412 RepID=T1FAV1_HELRO|nr:hypothetical protein HELRODRAFT_176740 [Helobdella robusta]ESN99572.1 hypothetical protein HELRODRAFT_176740 [Helobdella robusta]
MKVAEYRNQIQSHKNEIKMLNKILTQEVGENTSIQALMNNPGTWKGRVQQIITLQKKVAELKKQLEQVTITSSGTNKNDSTSDDYEDSYCLSSTQQRLQPAQPSFSSLSTINTTSSNLEDKQKDKIKQIEKQRKEATEKLKNDLKEMEQDLNNLKQKYEASKARNQVLSNESRTLKHQVQMLMEKGKHDDELVEALLKQQNQLKQALLTDSNNMKKDKQNEKNELNRLQVENNAIEQYKNEYEELTALYLAVTVERDKLNELLKVLESRSQQMMTQITELQSKLQNQLKINAALEKQIGKLKLEKGPQHSRMPTYIGGGDCLKQNDKEDLLMKIDIQKDEIEALKASLQSTMKSREEDMTIYTSILEESRRIFSETLRKERQRTAMINAG